MGWTKQYWLIPLPFLPLNYTRTSLLDTRDHCTVHSTEYTHIGSLMMMMMMIMMMMVTMMMSWVSVTRRWQTAATSDRRVQCTTVSRRQLLSDSAQCWLETSFLYTRYNPLVSCTSRDPSFITAEIKARLRWKNRLMHAGRVEEAGALARRIARDITCRSRRQLAKIDSKSNGKELWKAVNQLTGRQQEPAVDPNITADSLNTAL